MKKSKFKSYEEIFPYLKHVFDKLKIENTEKEDENLLKLILKKFLSIFELALKNKFQKEE